MTDLPKPIHARFEAVAITGGSEHRVILENLPPSLGEPRQTIYWRAVDSPGLELPPVLDSYVAGLALVASKAGRDLVVHAPMSRSGLYHISELLAVRHTLMPRRYLRQTGVMPDRVIDIARPAGDEGFAVAAVSGGLDSMFTAVRHALRLDGEASYKLAALVMVHGFDVPVSQNEQYARMRERARPIAERFGLPLHTVVTNVKQLDDAAWPESAIPLTANALAMFSGQCAIGLVSAGAPYYVPRMGITHPPVFDSMASNDWFNVVSDGGSFGRTDKVELVHRHAPGLLDHLKVCWEGSDMSRNCGVCQKCLLTRLNLLAAGIATPKCFDGQLTPAMVNRLRWRTTYAGRDFYTMCWTELQQRGIRGPCVNALRTRLARTPPPPGLPDLRPWLRARLQTAKGLARPLLPHAIRRAVRNALPRSIRP